MTVVSNRATDVPDGPRSPARRRALAVLATAVPAACLARVRADATGDVFLRVSRTLTGTEALSLEVADRLHVLLAGRIEGFEDKLDDLAGTLRASDEDRGDALAALDGERLDFALDIVEPWYLGRVGSPSSTILEDDAVFVTFLQAQAWEKIIDVVPRPTYPGRSAGWWASAPPGVEPPGMPDDILRWTFHPGGPASIQPPDPAWRSYAAADLDGVEAARRAKPEP